MQEYEMSRAELEKLLDACKSIPAIMLQCGSPPSQQENANRAWSALGDRMGFDGSTIAPSPKGDRFFFAEPKSDPLIDADH